MEEITSNYHSYLDESPIIYTYRGLNKYYNDVIKTSLK